MRRSAPAFLLLAVACTADRVVDLTHTLASGIPLYPGGRALELTSTARMDRDGYFMNTITVGEHTGTHVDAPAHFVEGRATAAEIPAERLVGPAVVVDLRAACAANADYRATVGDLTGWERAHGRIPAGAIVILFTGWQERWADPARYLNRDAEGVLHFPGISTEAAETLVERRIAGLGIDTLSVDYGPAKVFAAHKILHGAGIYHIENLGNLDQMPAAGATLVVAPLKLAGGSGAPCRVFGLK